VNLRTFKGEKSGKNQKHGFHTYQNGRRQKAGDKYPETDTEDSCAEKCRKLFHVLRLPLFVFLLSVQYMRRVRQLLPRHMNFSVLPKNLFAF